MELSQLKLNICDNKYHCLLQYDAQVQSASNLMVQKDSGLNIYRHTKSDMRLTHLVNSIPCSLSSMSKSSQYCCGLVLVDNSIHRLYI